MLVSSHSISIWQDWSYASKEIQDLFLVKNKGDLIVFVPRACENGEGLPEFLKLLEVTEQVNMPTMCGTVHVRRCKTNV